MSSKVGKDIAINGDGAVALAWKQINPDVCAAYPITPQTIIVEDFAKYVANAEVDTEFVDVESEHSALTLCTTSCAAGARTFTATASQGLAYMWEMLPITAAMRTPVMMAVANRTVSGPININNDHSDAMGARDAGWIQIYAENNQEVYDNYVQAFPIAETPEVRLPVMICQDGFITSHAVENIELLEDEEVKGFVGQYDPEHYLLNSREPLAVGPYDVTHYYMEHKKQEAEAMKNAKAAILAQARRFEALTGRKYGFFEEYRMEDAEEAVVVIGSTAGTAKATVDMLRAEGRKVGLVKVRVFRPFPGEELAEALKNCKAVAVMDKSEGFSACGGPLFAETRSALYDLETRPKLINIVYGLGGRVVSTRDIAGIYDQLHHIAQTGRVGEVYTHMGVREEV